MSFAPRLRALASAVNPTAIISNPLPLNDVRSEDVASMLWMRLLAASATSILVALAGFGVYALMSFSVTERTREVGIRRALGEPQSRIALTISSRSLAQLGGGILIGMPLALWVLVNFENDMGWLPTSSLFAVTLLLGVGVMVVIGSFACTVPLMRALRINPTEALREG